MTHVPHRSLSHGRVHITRIGCEALRCAGFPCVSGTSPLPSCTGSPYERWSATPATAPTERSSRPCKAHAVTVVGVGFWLLVSLVALGTLATTLPFLLLLLAILAILMWRAGVGRARVGLLSRRRLGLPLV